MGVREFGRADRAGPGVLDRSDRDRRAGRPGESFDVAAREAAHLARGRVWRLIGVNCGCLLTLWGSLATLLWRDRCDAARVDISWWSFLWRGLILTPLVVAGSVLALGG